MYLHIFFSEISTQTFGIALIELSAFLLNFSNYKHVFANISPFANHLLISVHTL